MKSVLIIKIILTIIAIFSFSLIIISTSQIISYNTSMTDNCKLKIDMTPLKTFATPPKDELEAETLVESFIQEAVDYMHVSIEPCGFVFYFNSTISGMYQLCDNGDLRTVNIVCDEDYSIADSTIDFFRK